MSKRISIIILTKDEEKQLETCLKSVSFADEIIIIDSGSTDKTLEIASKHTDIIIKHRFTDFSDLRNIGLKKANGDWILYVDADEEITPELKSEILFIIKQKAIKTSAYFIQRSNYFLGRRWTKDDKVERLFQKNKLSGWYGLVHESPIVDGETGELQNKLIHRTHNNLEEMLTNTIKWSDFEASARLKNHHPKITWWRVFRVMFGAFYNSYIKQQGFKAGTEGFIESVYQAFSMFITYAKLWEMQNTNQKIVVNNEKNY